MEGDGSRSRNGAVGETGCRERMQGSHAGSVHSEVRQQSSGTLQTNRKGQRESEGVDRRGEGRDEADAQAMQDA